MSLVWKYLAITDIDNGKRERSGSTRRGSGAELNAAPPRSVDHGAKIVYIPLCVTRTSPPRRRRRPPSVAGGNKM